MDPQQAGYYAQQPPQYAAAPQPQYDPQYYQAQQQQPQYFDPAAYAYQQAGAAYPPAQGYYPQQQAPAVDPQQYAAQQAQQVQQPVPAGDPQAQPQLQQEQQVQGPPQLDQAQQQQMLQPEQPAAPQEPPKRGFFARLFGRGGQPQPGQTGQGDIETGPGGLPGAAPNAGAPLPWGLSAMLPPGDSKDPTEGAVLSYEHAFKIHDVDPRVDQELLMQFDRAGLGGPAPLPARAAALRASRLPKEELGLYVEPQALLGLNSLFKMEQRLTKAKAVDKAVLADLVGTADDEAAAQTAAVQRKHAVEAAAQHHTQQQQLVVGALPVLAEEPEEGAAAAGGQQQQQQQAGDVSAAQQPAPTPVLEAPKPGVLGAAAPVGSGASMPLPPQPPQLITDPNLAWQALQHHQQVLTQMGAADPNHPNHPFLVSVQGALQQMAAGGPLPPIGLDGMPLAPEALAKLAAAGRSPWLDDNGLMIYLPDPVKREKERPGRRFDQDHEMCKTYVRRPIVENAGANAEAARTFRLDIELGRLEFLVHPSMTREDVLAARLLAAFKEFKRREAVGLASFYANKLAALEEALLAAREHLFALAEQAAVVSAAGAAAAAAIAAEGGVEGISAESAAAAAQGEAMSAELKEALDHTVKLEREVGETRQLKEEEEVFMIRAVESMQVMYSMILTERAQQGYWLTNLELSVQQRPPEEAQWTMGAGVPRDRLDAELLVAEEEAISGMPPPPFAFPAPPAMEDLPAGGFRPRRIEMTCASHKALVSDLANRLDALKGRPSADPYDPLTMQLEDQLRALGPVPRRLGPRNAEERGYAMERAAQRVLSGDVGVPRIPKLLPIITVMPNQATTDQQAQAQQGYGVQQQPGGMQQAYGVQQQPGGMQQPGMQQQQDPNQPLILGPKQRPAALRGSASRARYYAKLFVNGHYVDTCQDVGLSDDFCTHFKDIFSVQVVRWPESIMLQVLEKGRVRDTLIANVYVAVPGLAGSPHVDPKPVPYQFTSQTPYRVQIPGQQSPPGSPGRESYGPSNNPNLLYPTGAVYARCGWVSEHATASAHMADGIEGRVITYENPLADVRLDIEAPQDVMPPVPNITVDRMLRRAAERIGGKANRQQVLKWLNQNMIDPNDPRNAALMELMRAHEATSGGMGDLFRLDVFPDVALEEDRLTGKRATFLARRWATGPFRDPERSVLKGVRQVRIPAVLAARDAEDMEHLYLDALALVEMAPGGSGPAIARAMLARQDRATRMQVGPNLTAGIEEREARVKEFALRVRAAANRIAGGRQAGRKYKTDDVVNDTALPQFKVDLTTVARLVAPRRPLKRERKIVKSLLTSVPPDTELLITIQRATNLPVRTSAAPLSPSRPQRGGRGGNDLGSDQALPAGAAAVGGGSSVACFVEVRFRGLSRRTITSDDEFPTFNEQVMMPVFGTEEEPSPSALYENDDVVTINVFDEIINDRVGEPRLPSTKKEDEISDPVRYPERERRFLGCLRVPLSAVYQMQVLDGTFRLEVPPVMLGYRQRSERPPCVSLCMSLKPRLAPPAALPEDVLSGEMEDVTRHARIWMSELLELAQCRTRVIRALAVDPDGTSLLLTRYVCPLPLPPVLRAAAAAPTPLPGVSATEVVMLKIARFVAMVPYLEDSALQKRRVDVWMSAAETLAMAAGDGEEHAHLLAGYFMEIGQQAFVVMGASTYGAKSLFVLTTGKPMVNPHAQPGVGADFVWNELQLRLWNPLSGTVASVKDAAAEMREVGMVYDHTNMWANIQVASHPWELSWALQDPRLWRPFFGTQLPPREVATVQSPPMYVEREDLFYEQLETRVEEAVRDALQKARSLGAFVTKPDNKVSRVLKALLREMPARMEGVAAASLGASLALAQLGVDDGNAPPAGNGLNERHRAITELQALHNERVAREARAEWVNGHILCLPFSDKYAEAVTEAVLNTGVHRIADERVKYSMAAHVERGGAAFCCGLWIYVAATR